VTWPAGTRQRDNHYLLIWFHSYSDCLRKFDTQKFEDRFVWKGNVNSNRKLIFFFHKPKLMFLVSHQMHANSLPVRQCTASQIDRNIQVPCLVVPPKIILQNEENPSWWSYYDAKSGFEAGRVRSKHQVLLLVFLTKKENVSGVACSKPTITKVLWVVVRMFAKAFWVVFSVLLCGCLDFLGVSIYVIAVNNYDSGLCKFMGFFIYRLKIVSSIT